MDFSAALIYTVPFCIVTVFVYRGDGLSWNLRPTVPISVKVPSDPVVDANPAFSSCTDAPGIAVPDIHKLDSSRIPPGKQTTNLILLDAFPGMDCY